MYKLCWIICHIYRQFDLHPIFIANIREQRHIEKLKQRQDRQNHQATCYNTNHTGPCPSSMEEETVTSLWPDVEQIQSLQVDPHLPVTAFGSLIPSFTPR